MPKISRDFILMLNMGISIIGLLIVLVLTFNPPIVHEDFFWQKPLIGSLFSLICISGIFAALFPNQCSHAIHFRKESINLTSRRVHSVSHHPDCEGFSAHVIHVTNRRFCAACTGLLLGAIVALVGTVFYFSGGLSVEKVSFPITLIGVAGIVLGFLQLKFKSFVRLTLNVIFVLGAFLILVGLDELTKSVFVDLFLIAFIVFWILTRIQFSRWDHWRICRNCKSPCEVWEMKKRA